MLLAIDIGNTSITLGLFKKENLIKDFKISTHPIENISLLKTFQKEKIDKIRVSEVIICSVVPKVNLRLKNEIKNLFNISPSILGEDILVPIKNLYKNPKQVGQDRLVNAYAGKILYGVPLIVVDFGTAVTFDIVSKKGDYLGGIIAPGIDISRDVLSERTALLPKVRLKRPKELIGKTTQESILSGLFFGFGALVDGLIERLKSRLRQVDIKVIATGGNLYLLSPFCKRITRTDPHLTLKGILFVSQMKPRLTERKRK